MRLNLIRLSYLPLVYVISFFISNQIVFAQQFYQARVVDTLNRPVSDASVLLKNTNEKIIGYDVTDIDGQFKISLPDSIENMFVIIQKTGFKTLKEQIFSKQLPVKYVLKPWEEYLDEVTIWGQAIKRKGDTVIYKAAAFKTENDKKVEDLLKKLPGVHVSEDGTITYQNKPINYFFVENMDMTGGRYQRITKRLDADAIQSVEVIEDYKHIQALSDQFRDQIAMNLVLKDKMYYAFHLSGSMENEMENYDAQSDMMGFGKRFQYGINGRINNSGLLDNDKILTFNISDLLSEIRSYDYRIDWISNNALDFEGIDGFYNHNLDKSGQTKADFSVLRLTKNQNQW